MTIGTQNLFYIKLHKIWVKIVKAGYSLHDFLNPGLRKTVSGFWDEYFSGQLLALCDQESSCTN